MSGEPNDGSTLLLPDDGGSSLSLPPSPLDQARGMAGVWDYHFSTSMGATIF